MQPLSLTVTRVVESQEQIATMGLVDTADEQLILEQLIEASKPPVPASRKKGKAYHYLIQTAFRYPPLEHGSRFGAQTEPGIFYGSLEVRTALAETAYYRMLFWQGMNVSPPSKRIVTAHTSFEITIRTKSAVRLEGPSFDSYQKLLIHLTDYQTSQLLGAKMREAGVEAFTFHSARDYTVGINAGIFFIYAIINKVPRRLQQWICTTVEDSVTFINQNEPLNRYSF